VSHLCSTATGLHATDTQLNRRTRQAIVFVIISKRKYCLQFLCQLRAKEGKCQDSQQWQDYNWCVDRKRGLLKVHFLNQRGKTGVPRATSGQRPLSIRPDKLFVNLIQRTHFSFYSKRFETIVMFISYAALRKSIKHAKAKAVPLQALGGRGGIAPIILDLGTRWGWVVTVTPRPRFAPGKGPPGIHCTGGWVGPRAGLDTEVWGKIFCPRRRSNPDRSVVQPVVRHYTAWANQIPVLYFVYLFPSKRGIL
jgi:hypothetical protein